MKENYIFMVIILGIGYFITNMIVKSFKKSSEGNSIKQEEKISYESISFLIEGIFCIFSIYLVSKFQTELAKPVFYVEVFLVLMLVLDFIINLFKELYGFISYSKKGSMWSIIFVQFIKVLTISYLVYNYYSIYID